MSISSGPKSPLNGPINGPSSRSLQRSVSSAGDPNRRELLKRLAVGTLGLWNRPHAGWASPQTGRRDEESKQTLLNTAARSSLAKGLSWLSGVQHPDGAFGSGGNYHKNVAVAALAGMAFLAAGHTPQRGPFGETVQKSVDFILTRAQPSGYIVSEQRSVGQGPMYGHGFATMFLSEAFGMTPRPALRATIQRAVKLIVATQNQDGGWRYFPRADQEDVSVSVCQMVALRAARNAGVAVPKETVDRCVEYLLACQNTDGGFRYQLRGKRQSEFPRSAAAIVGLHSAGVYESPELSKALTYLTRNRPVERNRGAQDYFYYGQYYAAQALWQHGGERWESWYRQTRDDLIRRQIRNGSWSEEFICPEYGTAMALLILQMPNNHLPVFQR